MFLHCLFRIEGPLKRYWDADKFAFKGTGGGGGGMRSAANSDSDAIDGTLLNKTTRTECCKGLP
jgi:hypothetical protein